MNLHITIKCHEVFEAQGVHLVGLEDLVGIKDGVGFATPFQKLKKQKEKYEGAEIVTVLLDICQ